MKVLYLVQRLEDGEGSTEYIKSISGYMAEEGSDVKVVAFDDGSHYSIDERIGVERVELPFEGDNVYNWSMMMNNELKKEARDMFEGEKPDVIHAVDWTSIPGGVALSKYFDIPLVLTFQSTETERGFGEEYSGLISELEWQGAFEATKVLATGEDTKNSLLFDFDVPEEKIEVVDPFSDDWEERVFKNYAQLVKQKEKVLNN